MAPAPAGRLVTRRRAWRSGALRLLAALAAVTALAIGLAGCGLVSTSEPPGTPTDFPGLAGRLNAAGITVSGWVSGDAGCTDPDLVPAAISFSARGLDQATDVRLYLYVFRNLQAFDRHRAQIGPCATAFVTDPATYEEIEQSPYVLASQGPWAPGFEAALRKTLEAAAGTGG
jgi:hypothetical protein